MDLQGIGIAMRLKHGCARSSCRRLKQQVGLCGLDFTARMAGWHNVSTARGGSKQDHLK